MSAANQRRSEGCAEPRCRSLLKPHHPTGRHPGGRRGPLLGTFGGTIPPAHLGWIGTVSACGKTCALGPGVRRDDGRWVGYDLAKHSMQHLPLDGGGWVGVCGAKARAVPLRIIDTDLSPHPQPHAITPPVCCTKGEIMTSGWCGGDRVGWQSCRSRSKACRCGPVCRSSRCNAGGGCNGRLSRGEGRHLRRPGEAGQPGIPGTCAAHRLLRCDRGCAPPFTP